MSFDFDGFNDFLPGSGNVITSAQSGNVYRQVTVIAVLGTAINNATATWKVEETTDGGTTYVEKVGAAISRVATSGTSTVFHASTNSKAPQVKLTLLNNGTAATATYSYLLGKPMTAPFLGAQLVGIEDGYAVAPTA